MTGVSGLHHVSCVVSNAQRSLDFYSRGLGMTLVARTVNFDEPSILQLYCGDPDGAPGTIISLLEYQGGEKATRGSGQIGSIVFAIERGSGAAWRTRLDSQGFKIDGEAWSFGERHICLQDPDGLDLALVEDDRFIGIPLLKGRLAVAEPRVGRIASLELHLKNFEYTARLLTDVLGLDEEGREGPVVRFSIANASERTTADVLCVPSRRTARKGTGAVDCVVWSVDDLPALEAMRRKLVKSGYDTSVSMDRSYFNAVYFDGPEGISFGIACPTSGFPAARSASGDLPLSLPAWLEPNRGQIERRISRARKADGKSKAE